MNTTEINATRLTTIRGPVATELVTASRNHLRQKARLVAIGRSVAGSGFVVTTGGAATVQAPAAGAVPADWPTPDEIDAIVGTSCYGYA